MAASVRAGVAVIRLDAATVLVQWCAGGMLFLWVTTRRREVSLGYGWLLRGTFASLLVVAVVVALRSDGGAGTVGPVLAFLVVTVAALTLSVVRRRAGVSGHRAAHDRRAQRVAAMTGTGPVAPPADALPPSPREFDPGIDLAAALVGMAAVVAGALDAADGGAVLSVARHLAGAVFLGAVIDAMLLGHWYLVQPGLPRGPLLELVRWVGWTWPVEVVLLLVPTGMVSVLTGAIDDSYGGILGWFWVASAATTIILVVVTRAALRERYYSAVMAATGLLYLAILTALGTDLVARAVLS